MDFPSEPTIDLHDISLIFIFPAILLTSYLFVKYVVLRFNIDTWFFSTSPEPSLPNPVYQVSKTFNPFSLSLQECKQDQLHPLHLHLNAQVACRVHLLWGCLIHQIYPHIHQEWNSFLNTNLYDSICLKYEMLKITDSNNTPPIITTTLPLTIPPMNLGGLPRDKYPLVVVVDDGGTRGWGDDCGDDVSPQQRNAEAIGALISFIHLQDSLCPTRTHLFGQYVKTYAGYLHNIKPLFVSSSNEEDSEQPSQNTPSLPSLSSTNSSSSTSLPIINTINETANHLTTTARNRKNTIRNLQNTHIQTSDTHNSDVNITNTSTCFPINSSINTNQTNDCRASTITNANNITTNPSTTNYLTTTTINHTTTTSNHTTSNHTTNHTPSQKRANCVVCLEEVVEMVILPCRHTCVCVRCCDRLVNCPVCRGYIISTFAYEG